MAKGTDGQEVNLVKLMLLGDSAVGKSSLLVRFCEDSFPDDEKFFVTIGMDFKTKTIRRNGRNLRVDVWDTAGQEQFKSITPAFYRSAMGVLFCFDITEKTSFEHVEDWLASLAKYNGPDVPKVLVANKVDLHDRRIIDEAGAREFAEKHGMTVFETSAKTGVGVEEAFVHLAGIVADLRYKDSNQPVASGGGVNLSDKKGSKKSCAC
mmetsp:Transcript_27722/g.44023  ORF Transcript_27722/g.44023 Transcript_27722/m.44023 type:complete len:208 (-) Transcript_27722:8-631(-)